MTALPPHSPGHRGCHSPQPGWNVVLSLTNSARTEPFLALPPGIAGTPVTTGRSRTALLLVCRSPGTHPSVPCPPRERRRCDHLGAHRSPAWIVADEKKCPCSARQALGPNASVKSLAYFCNNVYSCLMTLKRLGSRVLRAQNRSGLC